VETSASFEARYAPLSYPTAEEKTPSRRPRLGQRRWGDALSGLRGVREAAKRDKRLPFTALLHHISVLLLESSFYALKPDAAPRIARKPSSSSASVSNS
jgi:hypothetical protein